jgi:hypothetical protein
VYTPCFPIEFLPDSWDLHLLLIFVFPEFDFKPRTVVELGEHLNALRIKYVVDITLSGRINIDIQTENI